MNKQNENKYLWMDVPVKRWKLEEMFHAVDGARSELAAAVNDGLVDDRVLAEIDETCDFLERLLNNNRD